MGSTSQDRESASPVPDSRFRVPARTWFRPVLLALGGLALAALLVVIDQYLAAVVIAIAGVFIAYWTSPLRKGYHVPFAEALTRRENGATIVLWAPGDPLSSRLQTAIRGEREDVAWVNVHQDLEAQEFLDAHGGRGALPLVLAGEQVIRRATVGAFLDAQAQHEHHGSLGSEGNDDRD